MKVVHVSNFTLRKNGENWHGIPYKLTNGLTRLGHDVFNYCDRDVANANPFRIRRLGHGRANSKLRSVCREMRPDLLLLGHCSIITRETIAAIRDDYPGIRIAHWNCDPTFWDRNFDHLHDWAPIADATFVTTGGDELRRIVDRGGRATFMPNPVDNSIEFLRVFEKPSVENDLVFVTGFRNFDQEKLDTCNLIKTRLPDLKFDVRGLYGQPGVFGAALYDVLGNAKMGLNVSKRNDVYLYSSDRMSQLMGCGILTIMDARARFGEIFGADELVTYNGLDEMVDKIDYFRRHDDERRATAQRGWKRVHEVFSETLVAQYIIDVTFDQPLSHAYVWPTKIFAA